jgi:ABC-type glutathione transport system ATPase component
VSTEPLLTVEGLKTHFHTEDGTVRAVDGVDFDVRRGETVAIVGESGSGKTVTSESVTKIIDIPPGEIVEGSVTFDGMELSSMSSQELQSIRGERISGNPGGERPHRRLPPRVLWGNETTRVDRDGARARPGPVDRRRADDRA